MNDGRILRHRFKGVQDRGKRLVVHINQLHGVSGLTGALGRHNGYRLPYITHFVPGQRRLLRGIQLIHGALSRHGPGRYVLEDAGYILSGQYGHHARQVAGWRRIHRPDPGMGVGAAQDGGVEQVGQLDVIYEGTIAGYQSGVFKSSY
jgi:hypothetical protein